MKFFWRLVVLTSLVLPLFSQNFVLYNPHALIVPKSEAFIELLSTELQEKTGFSLYVVAVDEIQGNDKLHRDLFKKEFLKNLALPYGAIFFFKAQRKIDIILQPSIQSIDQNKIISSYMVPILMQDKELSASKISASILNGYAQLADEIASHYGKTLENNLIVDKSGIQDYVHYLIYVMLGLTFALIGILYLTRKK